MFPMDSGPRTGRQEKITTGLKTCHYPVVRVARGRLPDCFFTRHFKLA